MVDEANRRFQQIQEAYQVLSDERKRQLYDVGLYDPNDEEDEVEGFADFMGEMMNMMANVRREEKAYTIGELQQMLADMVQGFDTVRPPTPPSSCSARWHYPAGDDSFGRSSAKRFRRDSSQEAGVFGGTAASYRSFGEFSSSCVREPGGRGHVVFVLVLYIAVHE